MPADDRHAPSRRRRRRRPSRPSATCRTSPVPPSPTRSWSPTASRRTLRRPHRRRRRAPRGPARRDHGPDRPQRRRQDDVLQPAHRLRQARRRARGRSTAQRSPASPPTRSPGCGMVRTFQLTKVLAKLTVMENMRLGATGQTRRERLCAALFPALWRGQEKRDHRARPTSCSTRFKLDAKRDDFAGIAVRRPAQAARDGAGADGRPEAGHARRADGRRQPGADAVAARPHQGPASDEGMTVLFVEHDMDMVRDIADWVVVMAEGQVIAEGPPDDGHAATRPSSTPTSARTTTRPRRRRSDLRASSTPRPRSAEESTSDRRAIADAEADRTSRRERHEPTGASATPTAADGAVVEVDDLVAGYLPGRQHPQRLPTCTASEGELIGIIGPNGAGKSTLLKAMFGLVKVRSRHGRAPRRGHHRAARPTSWSARASASCRRPTTCSRR